MRVRSVASVMSGLSDSQYTQQIHTRHTRQLSKSGHGENSIERLVLFLNQAIITPVLIRLVNRT